MTPLLKRQPLTDEEYLAAKARSAINKANGDRFEFVIAMLFVMRSAIRSMHRNCGDARNVEIHMFNGEFVDDLKVHLSNRNTTRFIHAKSGSNVFWKRNLIRDFKSQADRTYGDDGVALELWLTSAERKKKLAASIPMDMPPIKFVLWQDQWPLHAPWSAPRIARCLRNLVHQRDSEMLLENAWDAIKNACEKANGPVAVADIMTAAHVATRGAVNSTADPNRNLVQLLPHFRRVKGLKFAVDGDTLLFWNSDVIAIYSGDTRRVTWPQIDTWLNAGRPLASLTDFYMMLGGV